MLIEREIYQSYQAQVAGADEKKLLRLDEEVKLLCQWGERWSREVEDPGHKRIDVPMFYEHEGKTLQVFVKKLCWPLEQANPSMLKYVDFRLAEALRTVKGAGFERPSTVLSVRLFLYSHSEELGKLYDGQWQKWNGIQLLLQRLHSTTRISYRFEQEDRFGTRVRRHEDQGTEFIFGSEQWRRELIKRGVLKGKRKSKSRA